MAITLFRVRLFWTLKGCARFTGFPGLHVVLVRYVVAEGWGFRKGPDSGSQALGPGKAALQGTESSSRSADSWVTPGQSLMATVPVHPPRRTAGNPLQKWGEKEMGVECHPETGLSSRGLSGPLNAQAPQERH